MDKTNWISEIDLILNGIQKLEKTIEDHNKKERLSDLYYYEFLMDTITVMGRLRGKLKSIKFKCKENW